MTLGLLVPFSVPILFLPSHLCVGRFVFISSVVALPVLFC